MTILRRFTGATDNNIAAPLLANESERGQIAQSLTLEPGSWAFGVKFLEKLAEIKGFSDAQWAKRAGVSPAYLSELKTGKKKPTLKKVVALCQAVGADTRHAFPAPIDGVRQ